MQLRRLSVIGVGLLGASVGLAVKAIFKDCRVIGFGHRRATVETALKLGAIDEPAASLEAAVQGADLVVLCTPVGTFEAVLATIGTALNDQTVVTDVGSTKRSVVALGERLCKRFVGSHPMAGGEKRGPEVARADLFQGSTCILTPTPRTDPEAIRFVRDFWQQLGMRLAEISPDDHDRLLAQISHLPHAIAAALVRMQDPRALPLTGKGFLDATRIAAGDPGLWRDIFLDNREAMRSALESLRSQLDEFESLLDPQRAQDLANWLEQAARRRGELG